MSDTGKQSPLGINVLGAVLQNQGLWINPKVSGLVGSSKTNGSYSPGDIVNNTSLYWLTYAINDGYNRGPGYNPLLLYPPTLDDTTYNNLINIGQSHIPALGNSIPPSYLVEDPSGVWNGAATSGYGQAGDTDQGQEATWFPYNTSNPNKSVTQWGWLRLIALQAWNEFNYNGSSPSQDTPSYQYFVQSFLAAQGFVDNSNKAIYAIQDSKKFLQGVYSNMDDLTSSDITGVSLASRAFGQDLLNLGKALDLSTIATFGLPSNLLKTLKKSNTITSNLSYALLGAGLTANDITSILGGEPATLEQEQSIYGAFSVITETDGSLKEILTALNCKTKGLTSLVDLLNVKKMFPISYPSLTVPIYNTVPGPTNSKTYYLLFINGQLNPQLIAPAVAEQITPIVPSPPVEEPPAPTPPPPPAVTVEQVIAETPTTPQQRGGGGGCVALESFVPLIETEQKHNGRDITNAWMIEPNMKISLGHSDNLAIVEGKVVKAVNDYQPCVRIETADGISLVCSTTAPILTKENGFIPAPELFGKRVAVMRNNVTYYDEVVRVEDVGMKFVRVIDTGDNSFWAGATPDGYILHHNVIFNDTLNYNKF